MTLVLFMLCSGLVHVTFASHRLRLFYYSGNDPWDDSLNKCNTIQSLVTLYDDEDAKFLQSFMAMRIQYKNTWLGPCMRQKHLTNGQQKCGAIQNNRSTSFNCSDGNAFMCYKDGNYHLIENVTKNWCQAQQCCRKYCDDLVKVHDGKENQLVIENEKNKIFWIGLMHDKREWTDESCSTLRSCKNNYDTEEVTVCSKGHVRIIVIRETLTWEQALDYCKANHAGLLRIEDDNDQRAVSQWLNHTDGDGLFWIGLRQSRVFGFWIWSDRTVMYSHWKNDQQPEMPLSNNCGAINKTDLRWGDENCLHQHPFLCEEEISFTEPKIDT